jgi:20S proteasome subunit beta 6
MYLYRTALCYCVLLHYTTTAASFEPYQLNGGLVAAVAGPDFVVVATDTRLVGEGGYDILERSHLSSRLWTPDPSYIDRTLLGADGSVRLLPLVDRSTSADNEAIQKSDKDVNFQSAFNAEGLTLHTSDIVSSTSTHHSQNPAPVMIASAGCQVDCEALKRLLRSEVRGLQYWLPPLSSQLEPSQLSLYLSQALYRRRGFPFYSFCVCAGLQPSSTFNNDNVNDNDDAFGGHVYVYDAIGSYERVAVACNGSGREMLQPILDRSFTARPRLCATTTQQRSYRNHRPLSQVEDCTAEEAVRRLVQAYRAVAEREISVGDCIVLCVLQRTVEGLTQCQVWSAPLKTH